MLTGNLSKILRIFILEPLEGGLGGTRLGKAGDVCCQAERGRSAQMADSAREEEQVTLLGEEGLRAGGQALKLG